jgi:hypothetical protein
LTSTIDFAEASSDSSVFAGHPGRPVIQGGGRIFPSVSAILLGRLDGIAYTAGKKGPPPRAPIHGGLQHCIGKEVSRFEQGKDDFIENIDDQCIHYDGGRVTATESLIAEMRKRSLRKRTRDIGLDRKTIRAILKGKKVKASTLAKVVMGVREE